MNQDMSQQIANESRRLRALSIKRAIGLLLALCLCLAVFYEDIGAELVYRCYLVPACESERNDPRLFAKRLNRVESFGTLGVKAFAKLVLSPTAQYRHRRECFIMIDPGVYTNADPDLIERVNSICDQLADRLQRRFCKNDFRLLAMFGVFSCYDGYAPTRFTKGVRHRGSARTSLLGPYSIRPHLTEKLPRTELLDRAHVRQSSANSRPTKNGSDRYLVVDFPFSPGRKRSQSFVGIVELKISRCCTHLGSQEGDFQGLQDPRPVSKTRRRRWLKSILQYLESLENDWLEILARVNVKHSDVANEEIKWAIEQSFDKGRLPAAKAIPALIQLQSGDVNSLLALPQFKAMLRELFNRPHGTIRSECLSYFVTSGLVIDAEACQFFKSRFLESNDIELTEFEQMCLNLLIYRSSGSIDHFVKSHQACVRFERSSENGKKPFPRYDSSEFYCSPFCSQHSVLLELFTEKNQGRRLQNCIALQKLAHSRKQSFSDVHWALIRRCYLFSAVHVYDQIDSHVLELIRLEIRLTQPDIAEQDFDDLLLSIIYCGSKAVELRPELEKLKLTLNSKTQRLKLELFLELPCLTKSK